MARRKSSRGRVFYYPSSLPKMQDGDKLPTNQSEYEDVLGVIKEYRGYKPSDVNEVLNKIAWHESALSMDPTKKQELNDGSFGKGRGLYQFEPDALTTAINSTKNLYTNAGKEIPDWVKSIDTKDASILPASQQSALAAASMIQRENFIFDKALKSDEGLTEAWGKGWQTKNDPKKKELFKKHLESYYTKKEESPATFYSVYEEPGANIKPNPNLRTREEILSMLVGRDYTRTPKESSYNPQQRLIKDIMDENKALYKVGNPKDFNIIPADERMTQHLEKTGRGLEYLDAKDTWIPFKDRPTAKLRIPGEGANRVVINTEDIDPKELKEAVALDFISHSMDEDKTYRKYKDKINTELVNKYGQEFIDRNGGIDAYVRGIIADRNNPEYQPYKEETAFLNKSLVNDFKKYIKTGEKPSKGLFNFRYGGGITGNNDESNGLIPVRVDVANKSTTWNPKFTDIINNPSNYSQAEVIDAIQKMSALFPDSDKIITTPGVSPSEAGIRYVEPDPATGLPKLKNGGIPDRYKNKGFTKVGAKKQSTRPGKKWMVLAKKGDDYKVVHGGYKGMKDFSQHGSEDRKKKFWSRMGGKDSAKAKDPFSPLYWHKRFGTWEYGGDIQKQGYKDNSPYKNRRYIDIYSNNITMDGVSQPLQVTTDKGQQMVLPPNSGEYYFPNADAVRETPLVDLPSYFSGSKINLTRYQQGDSLAKAQFGTDIDDTLDKADSEVYRLYLSGKHLKQGYPDAEQSGTGRLYPDAKEVSPNFEYEGDKHWNTKRFAYAPFFNKIETDGYHYRTNDGGTAPLDLPKGDKARKKMLIGDMATYFKASGYSDEEANQQAKNYVKKEVMPLVNSKWDKQHDKGKSSIGRVDQFDAPQLYNYVDSKGEKKLEKLFYDKKENKRLNEGYIQSPKKLKRLDKDFNIKFRGLSKQDAKTEANFNYNNYKDKRYTVAQFKADKKSHGYQNGGSLPMYQKGDKIPTYMVPEVEVQAFPNATPAQRAALRTGPSNPIYRNAKSQLMNNKKPGNFTNETADAFGYLVAEGPMEVLQIPQSLLVEGIEAARGNDYNFKNALPPYVSGDTNKQRLPSQTFLQNAPFPLQLAGDILIDPFAVAGAAKGGISAARYAKNFPKAFALNLDDVGRQAFKPMKSPNVGKGFKSEINWGKWNPDTPKYPELINEYNAIEESTKKAGTWMKNPDGSPFVGSNPTKEELLQYGVDMTPEEAIKAQFIQQQSSFLKNYIKDSKLINPDGSPTIQYHGSAKKFDTFDESKFQLGDAGYSGSGIYTSPSKITANSYAMSSSKFHSGKIDPTVYHLYGQAKNPITSKQLIDNTGGDIYPFGTTLTDANKINKNLPFDLFNFHRKSAPIKDQLLDFDAAIRNQTRGVSKILPTNDAIEIVFPKNTQVKSAVGNVGFFDMTNPNIYKSVAPLVGAGVLGSQYFSDPQEQVKYQQGGLLPNTQIMIDPATGLPKLKSGGKTWIQEAIKKPGSLRATAKRAGAIKSDGTIKKIWLKEKAKGSGKTA